MGKSSKEKKHKRDRESRHKHKKDRKKKSRHNSSDDDSQSSDDSSDSRSRSRSPRHHKKHSSSSRGHRSRSPRDKQHGRHRREREEEDPEAKRLREAAERRKQKEIIKALETPEEKRARRLAKKEAKDKKRKEEMGWDKDYLGYTNGDNPFGDEHLLDTFVWTKKLEKEGKKDLSVEEIQKMHRTKMITNKAELVKVKNRRLEREKEWDEREKDKELQQREKELEYFAAWEKQEDGFHLNQAKLRSEIRIKDGRAKPIDLLAKYISAEDDELAVEMHEPYTYLYGLTIQDLEDLLEDIKVYLELEEGKNAHYWRDIITVTKDELAKLKKLEQGGKPDVLSDRRSGINSAVSSEIADLFKGKSTNQLKLLETSIKDKLRGGEGIDVGYWESLLQQLKAHKARTRLRERHQDVLRQKLHTLKREQGIESQPLFPVVAEPKGSPVSNSPKVKEEGEGSPERLRVKGEGEGSDEEESEEEGERNKSGEDEASNIKGIADKKEKEGSDDDSEDEEEDDADPCETEYLRGCYSPVMFTPRDLTLDSVIYDEEDDHKKLQLARSQVIQTGRVRTDGETEFEKKAREGMDMDEAQFSVEVNLEQQAFMWSDKYRPRKPRFFNRVHTGFEWNKYNQTHYDIDNPPPKIVQGYKFNIFYPDLIDKANTPEYFVTPLDGSKDFALLRFHAGPPYEDIAFKIVNREWEYSYKRGFRCQFYNNIFQLWFHFKRYRYRR